jgi:hypothetical protein
MVTVTKKLLVAVYAYLQTGTRVNRFGIYYIERFAHDITAAMLVFQFKIILIRLFCLEHQHGSHGFC